MEETFIDWLSRLDIRAFATLRRSLGHDLDRYTPAYPYVEPFISRLDFQDRRRKVFYLVAGLYCLQNRAGDAPKPIPLEEGQKRQNFGHVVAKLHQEKYPEKPANPSSLEQRFIALLDADDDQRPHHLRQMFALLKEQTIDWVQLTHDLLYWGDRTKQEWARAFYRNYVVKTAETSEKSEHSTQGA